jgi:hypothetical protein
MIPYLFAKAPVTKGKIAEPDCPNPAIHPMLPESNLRGMMRPVWDMTIGKKGPRAMPTKETATAFSIKEGTNQMVISSLVTTKLVFSLRDIK